MKTLLGLSLLFTAFTFGDAIHFDELWGLECVYLQAAKDFK